MVFIFVLTFVFKFVLRFAFTFDFIFVFAYDFTFNDTATVYLFEGNNMHFVRDSAFNSQVVL